MTQGTVSPEPPALVEPRSSVPEPLQPVLARALRGDGSAARSLGDRYREGAGVPFRPRRAFRWYVRAAFAGDATAMNQLGACYHNGIGCPVNMKQAVHWYRQGARRGCPHAQENLGHCYLKGLGAPKDRDLAIRYLRQAAAQGHEKALKRLEGLGVPVHLIEISRSDLASDFGGSK